MSIAVAAAGVLGYRAWAEPKLDGLANLPSRPCDGLVERGSVQALLPPVERARDLVDRDTVTPSEYAVGRAIECHISTPGAGLQSSSQVVDRDPSNWGIATGGLGYNTWNEEKNGLYLTTRDYTADVYLPCTPHSSHPKDAKGRFGLTVHLELLGDPRPTGKQLRRDMVTAALQIAEASRKDLGCQEHAPLPKKAPPLISH